MSTSSLPSYLTPLLNRTPSYATENYDHEQHVPLADRLRPRSLGAFVKQSRGGNAFLRLSAQEDDISLPVYGSGSLVEGTVELTKTEGVTSVEVKVGKLLRILLTPPHWCSKIALYRLKGGCTSRRSLREVVRLRSFA